MHCVCSIYSETVGILRVCVINMNDYQWADKYPNIQKICKLFDFSVLSNPLRFNYKYVESIIQEGPQCGLVALAMILEGSTKDSVKKIFETAKKLNYTYNGEMFSAADMCALTKSFLPNKNIKLHSGNLFDDYIKEFLLEGGCMLVPYDSDRDHSPCSRQGHKAHWALITGGVEADEENFYVFAHHGKSKNVGVWKLKDLAESNSQLTEFSPDRKLSDVTYKLPEGGISGNLGLKLKAVFIYN